MKKITNEPVRKNYLENILAPKAFRASPENALLVLCSGSGRFQMSKKNKKLKPKRTKAICHRTPHVFHTLLGEAENQALMTKLLCGVK